jgi:ABC-type polysaccharide/polyol phosphate transport system ATPase subunit
MKDMKPVFGHHARAAGAVAGESLQVDAPPGVLLQARDVRKAYGRHEVLRGADLAAGPGELIGVVGENGAGSPPC